ncbi:hypothetical protein NDU88_003876 [Pleurodeles waltl]|uniref:Uncharacterized protein n=1 Tax=Pleurodeles waltl TaxID=8319 RepID=A0AAV7LGP2_PLEWA|nr:hypothetical protein NDU88_003876 [Pleurodeles waltl]
MSRARLPGPPAHHHTAARAARSTVPSPPGSHLFLQLRGFQHLPMKSQQANQVQRRHSYKSVLLPPGLTQLRSPLSSTSLSTPQDRAPVLWGLPSACCGHNQALFRRRQGPASSQTARPLRAPRLSGRLLTSPGGSNHSRIAQQGRPGLGARPQPSAPLRSARPRCSLAQTGRPDSRGRGPTSLRVTAGGPLSAR